MTTQTLFVTWFDPERRDIFPVGRLVRRQEPEGELYEFTYIRGARQAKERGFLPFLAFPDLGVVYRSRRLFPFFTNRVMPTTRPDYAEMLQALALDRGHPDAMEVLGRSGGGRETDRIEIVPQPALDEATGAYTTHFLVRGIKHTPGAEERIGRLQGGERLLWMLDAQNAANPNAVALRTEDRYLLGYVPDYLLTDVGQLVERRAPTEFRVERVNLSPAPVHHRLLCRLEARAPQGFAPFQDDRFRPIGTDEARKAENEHEPRAR
jgi:hypothetical protein